jgi:hypothetical protein
MDAGKGIQLKIDILCPIHFIVLAWQQVTQSTIQNCFVTCGHVKKNQDGSDMTEVDGSGEDDITRDEDWVQQRASTTGMDFDAYMSVDQELTTCGVLCMEGMCGVVGSESCVEEGEGDGGDDEAESEPVLSFMEALHAFESMRALMYAHNITKRDQANIVNIEMLLVRLKRKGAAKQMRINNVFKKEVIQIGLDSGNNIIGVCFFI